MRLLRFPEPHSLSSMEDVRTSIDRYRSVKLYGTFIHFMPDGTQRNIYFDTGFYPTTALQKNMAHSDHSGLRQVYLMNVRRESERKQILQERKEHERREKLKARFNTPKTQKQ